MLFGNFSINNTRGVLRTLPIYQTTMMELFCGNSQWLRAVDYFHKKRHIVDVRWGPKHVSIILWEKNSHKKYISKNYK